MPMTRRLFLPVLVFVLSALAVPVSALSTAALPGRWTDALTVLELPDGSLLVAQSSGLVDRLIGENGTYREPTVWADLSDGGQATLLGLAVDPDFLSSGYLYALTRTEVNGTMVAHLTRWRDAGGLVVLNRVLVDDLPSGQERAGGVVKVGPDGKLWVALGDGGAPASEATAANLRGVLLRYNDDGSLPADNPDPASPVWAKGFRDPSGLAWQPGTDRLYSLDRGAAIPKGTNDRLDVIEKKDDLGWPKHMAREKARGFTQAVIYCSSGHSWVPGGAVFATVGSWKGSLLFAGSGEGVLYRLSLDAKAPKKILFYEELINGALGPLVDVAVTADGRPLLLAKDRLYLLNSEDCSGRLWGESPWVSSR